MKSLTVVIGVMITMLAQAQEPNVEAEEYFPQQLTAEQLLYACASSKMTNRGRAATKYCSGFISGVEETIRLQGRQSSSGKTMRICVPKGAPASRFVHVFVNYASKKTTGLDKPAALIAIESLEHAFPCE